MGSIPEKYARSRVRMEPDNMSIPVVDIAEVLSRSERLDSCDAVEELHSAFTTVGFVFIRNHGIDKKLVGIGNQKLSPHDQVLLTAIKFLPRTDRQGI